MKYRLADASDLRFQEWTAKHMRLPRKEDLDVPFDPILDRIHDTHTHATYGIARDDQKRKYDARNITPTGNA